MGLISDAVPPNAGDFDRRIKRLEMLIQRLIAGRSLENAEIDNAPGKGIRTSDFDGTGASNPGTHGNYFGGDIAIIRKLLLGDNLVSNDALENPTIPGSKWLTTTNFGVSPTWTAVISTTVPVPAGVTALQFSAKVRITAFWNGGTASDVDYLYSRITVAGLDGGYYPLAVSGAGGSGTNQTFRDDTVAVTAGSNVSITVEVSSDYNTWAASTNNKCVAGVQLIWYR